LLKLRPFVIETDHKNLVFLDELADNTGNRKLARWRMVLLEYTFIIEHVAGKDNNIADALSRLGHAPIRPQTLDVATVATTPPDPAAVTPMLDRIRAAQTAQPAAWKQGLHRDESTDLLRDPHGRVLIPDSAEDLMSEICRRAHGTPFTGHVGTRRTMDNIQNGGFTFSKMEERVGEFVAACPACQKARLRRHVETELHVTPVTTPFHTLCIDTLGPFTKDKYGNQNLKVMIDKFSGWVELHATPTNDPVHTAEGIVTKIFLRFGLPMRLTSDNGPEYANAVVDQLTEVLKVRHHRTIPYHPQGNGVVERVNQEVLKHLRCLCLDFDSRDNWTDLLPFVQHILNNSVNSRIGKSPYEILFGDHLHPDRDMVTVLTPEIEHTIANIPDLEEGNDRTKAEGYLSDLKRRLATIRAEAQVAQEKAALKTLKKNQGKKFVKFAVGDFVLVEPIDKRRKLEAPLEGPYKIIAVPFSDLYQLQALTDPRQLHTVHAERLQPFYLRDDVTEQDLTHLAADNAGEFNVQAIVDHIGTSKRSLRFRVKWSGYPNDDDDTWEPLLHLMGRDGVPNQHLIQYLAAHPDVDSIVHPTA